MKYILSLVVGILPVATFALPYIEISPDIPLKKTSERYQTYENNIDVLMLTFNRFVGAYFLNIPFQNLKKDRNMYQSGTYAYFSQWWWAWHKDKNFLDFVNAHPEWSEQEAEKEYAREQYQKKLQEAKELFFEKLDTLPYTSEHIEELKQLFHEENFEKIVILLPEYTKNAVENLNTEEKYAFFRQKRTPIPLYETAVNILLSPEKIPNFESKIYNWSNHMFSIFGWNDTRVDSPEKKQLFTDTHITETYEFTLWDKADFNIQLFPVHDAELFDRGSYFQKQILFLDTTLDIYNVRIHIEPKIHPKFLREGYPEELRSEEWPGMRSFIPDIERKHQLAEYRIPIKEYYPNGDARMDFWENNTVEMYDAYSPCNTTIVKNICISQAIYPYYEANVALPLSGEYILTLEYDTYQPAINDQSYYDEVFSQDRTILFEEKSIPKTIQKRVSDFVFPK